MPYTSTLLLGIIHELDQGIAGDADAPAYADALDVAILYELISCIAANAEQRSQIVDR